MSKPKYGFYSEKLHVQSDGSLFYLYQEDSFGNLEAIPVRHSGASIYLDENGNEVMVNWVSENPNKPNAWGDMVYVGKVNKWVRDAPMKSNFEEFIKEVKSKMTAEEYDKFVKITEEALKKVKL